MAIKNHVLGAAYVALALTVTAMAIYSLVRGERVVACVLFAVNMFLCMQALEEKWTRAPPW